MPELKDENLRVLYQELMNERRLYTDKLWETVKFFTTIYTAILSITIILIVNLYDRSLTFVEVIPISLFPIVSIFISYIGWKNFRREQARYYETIATLKKVEKPLGLFKIKKYSDRIFKKDKYLLPNYFVDMPEEVKKCDTEQYIDWLFKNKNLEYGKFYSTFTWLFRIYVVIAIVIIFLVFMILPK